MSENQYFWNNVFLLSIGTLVIRGSIVALSSRIQISTRWKELFSYIPAAILPAFIAPAVFFHQGGAHFIFGKERFAVLGLASVVCYLSRNTLATIAFGLVALYLVRCLI